jgi:hypothetical protein
MMGEVAFDVSDVDNGLRERLNDEINAFNVAATGHADDRLLCIGDMCCATRYEERHARWI